MVIHSVFLPGESDGQRKEPGGLQSMGSQRVGHDRVTNTTSVPPVCMGDPRKQ